MEKEKTTGNPNPEYSIFSAKYFFGIGDPVRLTILIYILISIILNIINIFTVIKSKMAINIGVIVQGLIVIVNFIHTFTYLFEWVFKPENGDYNVGNLLIGNPKNFGTCTFQAFSLISSSISQDFLINILFYLINLEGVIIEKPIYVAIVVLGFVFPIIFTLVYYFIGGLGLNDRFCYVTKYEFDIRNNQIDYYYYNLFQPLAIIVYVVRFVNFIVSIYFTVEIIKYIKQRKEKLGYAIKMLLLPIVQLITVSFGIIYRFSNLIDANFSANFSPIYLIVNTADGIFFPLAFGLNNYVYTKLLSIMKGMPTPEPIEPETPPIEFSDRISDNVEEPFSA